MRSPLLPFLIVVFCSSSVSVTKKAEDPLCLGGNVQMSAGMENRLAADWGYKRCPRHQKCHVMNHCPEFAPCRLQATCLSEPPTFSHVGHCKIGDPILKNRTGMGMGDLYCGPSMSCPNSTYCNTELMDTYSFCCRSDTTTPETPGTCPPQTRTDTFFCVDTCNNDGDCHRETKCCQNGCALECVTPIPPPPPHPCENKDCGEGYYCRRNEPCPPWQQCYPEGHCSPCPMVSCRGRCMYGYARDKNGCQTCACVTPPPRPVVYVYPRPVYRAPVRQPVYTVSRYRQQQVYPAQYQQQRQLYQQQRTQYQQQPQYQAQQQQQQYQQQQQQQPYQQQQAQQQAQQTYQQQQPQQHTQQTQQVQSQVLPQTQPTQQQSYQQQQPQQQSYQQQQLQQQPQQQSYQQQQPQLQTQQQTQQQPQPQQTSQTQQQTLTVIQSQLLTQPQQPQQQSQTQPISQTQQQPQPQQQYQQPQEQTQQQQPQPVIQPQPQQPEPQQPQQQSQTQQTAQQQPQQQNQQNQQTQQQVQPVIPPQLLTQPSKQQQQPQQQSQTQYQQQQLKQRQQIYQRRLRYQQQKSQYRRTPTRQTAQFQKRPSNGAGKAVAPQQKTTRRYVRRRPWNLFSSMMAANFLF